MARNQFLKLIFSILNSTGSIRYSISHKTRLFYRKRDFSFQNHYPPFAVNRWVRRTKKSSTPNPKRTYDMVTGLEIEISSRIDYWGRKSNRPFTSLGLLVISTTTYFTATDAPSPKTTLLTETLARVKQGKRRGEALMWKYSTFFPFTD